MKKLILSIAIALSALVIQAQPRIIHITDDTLTVKNVPQNKKLFKVMKFEDTTSYRAFLTQKEIDKVKDKMPQYTKLNYETKAKATFYKIPDLPYYYVDIKGTCNMYAFNPGFKDRDLADDKDIYKKGYVKKSNFENCNTFAELYQNLEYRIQVKDLDSLLSKKKETVKF